MDFEQLQILAKEQKDKVFGYEARLKELTQKCNDQALVNAAELALIEMLREDKKKIIRDLVDKIVVYEGGDIELAGHLPQFDHKLGCFYGDRNCGVGECGEIHAV